MENKVKVEHVINHIKIKEEIQRLIELDKQEREILLDITNKTEKVIADIKFLNGRMHAYNMVLHLMDKQEFQYVEDL